MTRSEPAACRAVYRDGSLLDTVDTSADCLVVAEPLGRTYTVAAVNEVGSSSSTEAQLVSHDPWYDSCNVVDSGSDEADFSLSADYCGGSLMLDPEIKDVWIHCTFTSDSDGIVMVGVTDDPVDPTCTDEPSWRYVDQQDAYESCECDFHVTDAWMASDKPTYLTVFIEPMEGQQNWSSTCAEFSVNGIKPFWVDVGIAAPDGGLSRDESDAWVDTSGADAGGAVELPPVGGRLHLRILVDRTSLEVFGNDGRAAMTSCFLPKAAEKSLAVYATGGAAKIVSLQVFTLKSAWPAQ